MKDISDLIGRILISVIFFFEAYDTAVYKEITVQMMTLYGLTWQQNLLYIGVITVLLLGATLILLGYRAPLGATLLLCYLVPYTFIVHDFWNDPPHLLREQSIHFMKNIGIIGALLLIFVNGSGKYSMRRLFATTHVRSL